MSFVQYLKEASTSDTKSWKKVLADLFHKNIDKIVDKADRMFFSADSLYAELIRWQNASEEQISVLSKVSAEEINKEMKKLLKT